MTLAPQDLPRVTYTGTDADLAPLHDFLDTWLPAFRAALGRTHANRIAGIEDRDGPVYEVRSPLDHRLPIGRFVAAGEAAVARAVAAARAALPAWAGLPWEQRVQRIRAFARALEATRYELAMAVLYEVGKNRLEAMGEVEEAVALLDHYAAQMTARSGYVEPPVPSGAGETAQVLLRPYGVFAVIAPFNYPSALVTGMVGAALVAGNTVVLKPSPESGLTASLFVEAGERAGLPPGTLNLLCGEAAGPLLVEAPGIDGFAFTGSHAVGMEILRRVAAGRFMRPVLAELGGKNAAYVTASADLGVAVEGIARSAFSMAGQKCSACSVAFVHAAHYEAFLEALRRRGARLADGSTERREISHGPLVNEAAWRRYQEAVAHGRRHGRVLCGGGRLTGPDLDHGWFVPPAIVADLPAGDRLFHDELFAPVLAVARFERLEEAIDRANAALYGLTTGFYGSDPAEIALFLDRVQSGVLYVNRRTGATTGAWPGMQSFCGWKGSGLTGKGGLGPHYLAQFMREQCRTIRAL
jgi:1-pyrroline-5-carboxylate dehydrogenase